MTEFRVLIAETVTGTVKGEAKLSARPGFNRELCQKGTWDAEVILDGKSNKKEDFQVWATSPKFSWAVTYGDTHIPQAGPPTSYQFDEKTRKLRVSGTGIGGLLDQRVVRNPAGDASLLNTAGNNVTYSAMTLRGILNKIVSDNLTQAGYSFVSSIGAGFAGTETRTYNGYDAATVWNRITDLAETSGGPEFYFTPFFAITGALAWGLSLGDPLLGDQNPDMAWDQGAALGRIDIDGNCAVGPVHRAYTKGSGDKESTIIGYAQNTAALIAGGYPGIDYVNTSHTSSATTKAIADGYAAADLASYATATETWKAHVRIDGTSVKNPKIVVSPALGTWSLGVKPLFRVQGHPWIPDGGYRRRIIGYSSGDPGTVELKLAPAPTVV